MLSRVDLIVHHGGTGSVLGALAAGMPQLIMPQGADQFFNAEFLTEVGAARALLNEEQDRERSAGRLWPCFPKVPSEPSLEQLQAEIAAMPLPADVIPELAALAGVRRHTSRC